MNELKVFTNEQFGQVRTLEENGNILFCGSDVAKSLGYSNPRKAMLDHCQKDGVTIRDAIDKCGRTQQVKFINEGNLYRLIAHSKLPSAEKFEHWVFDEVLPTIRKTGGYVSNEDMFINTYLPFADKQTKMLFKSTLETVDHYITSELGIKYYGRYMDDFYLIHPDKNYLKYCLKQINKIIGDLKLSLNGKTQIMPFKQGVKFLGFHTYINDGKIVCKIRNENKRNAW